MLALALALAAAAPDGPVRLATYHYPRYDRAKALEPLRVLLQQRLSRPVIVEVLATPDALRDAVRAGTVDIAMTNLSSYLGMAGTRRLDAVAVLDVPAATLERYRGVLLARKEAGVEAPAALPARAGALRYAEVLPGSTSGALVQSIYLRSLSTDPARFAVRLWAGTHDGALAMLLDGRADVAALAEEPWRNASPEVKARMVQLWRSEPLPPGPLICVSRVGFDCGAVKRLVLSKAAAPAAAELARGWSETEGAARFRKVRRDYAQFRRL
ncbi:PhnD/SsuA/transferrin family substrate-binding protein [Sphingomonas sp. ID1715]|uniref:phosphate/phosphite/phosphonate ABC transporter substrate-binding protein n=1 Tax=Sphingomonas sp. ID1715 TaxID=1656898 RepID=UPI001487C130|nr:PhnD/SsuA/transferrin family substrate-binding protein [Sphingomonas sp. ID1715]NNM75381.1 PhnD/SsuA/transferrin family substrate-binding protein [Sphingomonas sp. ID1715]